MQGFQELYSQFQEANAQVLGVSIDPWPSQGAFAKSLGLGFPLLSDWPKNEVCRLYDVFREEASLASRVTYVIDKQGVVRGKVENEPDMLVHAHESLQIVKEIEGKP